MAAAVLHPDYPRILAVFHDSTGPPRARDIWQALDFELLPKHIERTRAKMKRLVTPAILAEAEPGTSARSSNQVRNGHQLTNRPLTRTPADTCGVGRTFQGRAPRPSR